MELTLTLRWQAVGAVLLSEVSQEVLELAGNHFLCILSGRIVSSVLATGLAKSVPNLNIEVFC